MEEPMHNKVTLDLGQFGIMINACNTHMSATISPDYTYLCWVSDKHHISTNFCSWLPLRLSLITASATGIYLSCPDGVSWELSHLPNSHWHLSLEILLDADAVTLPQNQKYMMISGTNQLKTNWAFFLWGLPILPVLMWISSCRLGKLAALICSLM